MLRLLLRVEEEEKDDEGEAYDGEVDVETPSPRLGRESVLGFANS